MSKRKYIYKMKTPLISFIWVGYLLVKGQKLLIRTSDCPAAINYNRYYILMKIKNKRQSGPLLVGPTNHSIAICVITII